MEDRRIFPFGFYLLICAAVSAFVSCIVTLSVLGASHFFSIDLSSKQSSPSDFVLNIPDVVAAVQPSVVAVNVSVDTDAVPKRLRDTLPDPSVDEIRDNVRLVSSGSGFFVSESGLLVTNRHVVDIPDVLSHEKHIFIVLHTGEKIPAQVQALDPVLDIAFLSVSSTHTGAFPVLRFASSSQLRVGETVLAVGNALSEFPNTVTRGVVSGLNRRVWAEDDFGEEILEEAIQTDAAINPGNSGGPLLNESGKVVGMNTAVAEDGQSLGFALPGDALLRSIESVKRYGRVVRPFLGVRYELLDGGGAEIMKGVGNTEPAIAAGSPAEKAGLREGDLILSIDDISIDEAHTPVHIIGKHQVGETVHIEIMRDEKTLFFEIPLAEFVP